MRYLLAIRRTVGSFHLLTSVEELIVMSYLYVLYMCMAYSYDIIIVIKYIKKDFI